MPRPRGRKPKAKPKYPRKRKTYKRRDHIPLGKGMAFPVNNTVRMRFVSYEELQPQALIQVSRYRANGAYDPEVAAGGTSPMGWTQYSQFYNHYVVKGAKITATLTNGATVAANGSFAFGVYLSDDTTTPTTWPHLLEIGRGSQTHVAPNINKAVTCKGYFGKDKFFSKNMDKGATSALVTSTPTEEAYFNVYVQSLDLATTAGANAQIKIVIDYIVTFFEPKDLTRS